MSIGVLQRRRTPCTPHPIRSIGLTKLAAPKVSQLTGQGFYVFVQHIASTVCTTSRTPMKFPAGPPSSSSIPSCIPPGAQATRPDRIGVYMEQCTAQIITATGGHRSINEARPNSDQDVAGATTTTPSFMGSGGRASRASHGESHHREIAPAGTREGMAPNRCHKFEGFRGPHVGTALSVQALGGAGRMARLAVGSRTLARSPGDRDRCDAREHHSVLAAHRHA